MTKAEAVKWLESLKQEIGKTENCSLWHYAEAIDMVIEAMSEPKTGKWIQDDDYICDQCGYHMIVGGGAYNYCPNCGANMR